MNLSHLPTRKRIRIFAAIVSLALQQAFANLKHALQSKFKGGQQ
jgi:hypothetical protein